MRPLTVAPVGRERYMSFFDQGVYAPAPDAPIMPAIVALHAEEAATIHAVRTLLAHAPRCRLADLRRFDDRLAAHLEGLRVAGDCGWRLCEAALDNPTAGTVFTLAVRAIEEKQDQRVEALAVLVQAAPELRDGFLSAFGWLERERLQGVVVGLLGSSDAARRTVGVAACGMHRVDGGNAADFWLRDEAPAVRAAALRGAGESGSIYLQSACSAALKHDPDADCRFWAAWSTVLLGGRGAAVDALVREGEGEGLNPLRGFRLAMQALDVASAHAVLEYVARDPGQLPKLVSGAGLVGDPMYVPWLLGHMANNETTRLAGEAVSLITGIDLEQLDFQRDRPADFIAGPTDDPDDPRVDMDVDEDLPWPDVGKIDKWWSANGNRFQKGIRYFMGAPVTREHCIEVLKNGYQRQRILAAHYLCLLEPGTPLFNTSAPAWRQQRLLAEMK